MLMLYFSFKNTVFYEVVTRGCSVKKMFLKIPQNSQEDYDTESTNVGVFKYSRKSQPCNFIEKETPTQLFYCEFCEIFKNTLLWRTPPVTACLFYKSAK